MVLRPTAEVATFDPRAPVLGSAGGRAQEFEEGAKGAGKGLTPRQAKKAAWVQRMRERQGARGRGRGRQGRGAPPWR